ncbi:TonB-dependent receptor [Chitinophaga caseinilytica]|uniref:TonB-dependent receptor n=1 Tax=Chitinophaga caseinilytica TaxID=2267521 RepID=A0ABZ2Z7L6_9BACT
MKLTILMLTVVLMQVSNAAFSQKITIQADKASLRSVLAAIREQSGFQLLYSTEALDRAETVTVRLKDATLEHALAQIFNGQPLTYKLEDRMILVTLKPSPTAIFELPAAKEMTVTGTVTNATGDPIPGASLQERGTGNGTVTDGSGRFTLRVKSDTATLIVRSMGFTTQEVKVAPGTMRIVLKDDQAALSEVVVVGFGTQKKANLTGAVSSVNMDEVLGNRPVSGTAQALQGAVPGLQITFGSGQPGASANINLRGYASINGGGPLVLVDNVPMSLDDINPRDIENITVLKDAAAASIYGARAAFGVILITTKKGRRNSPTRFNYYNNFTWSKPASLPEKATPVEMVQALKDFGNTSYWSGQDVDKWLGYLEEYRQDPGKFPNGEAILNGLHYPLAQQDLYGQLFNGGVEQQHNFSFSGGSEKSTYRVSGGYSGEDGIMTSANDKLNRYNFNASLTTDLTSKLRSTVSAFYRNDHRRTPSALTDLFYNAITLASFVPIGESVANNGRTLPYSTPNNVARIEAANVAKTENLRLFGKVEYTPFKNFRVDAEYTFFKNTDNGYNTRLVNDYIDPSTYDVKSFFTTSRFTRTLEQRSHHAFNLYGTYNLELNGGHNFKAMAGTNMEIEKGDDLTTYRENQASAFIPTLTASSGPANSSDAYPQYAVQGFFGRINYDYKGRYLLELNGRYDGSSKFPPGDRFGFFPSVSAGWNVMEERFMGFARQAVQQFKLRGSFGEIGNQATQTNFPYFPGMDPYVSGWVDETGTRASSLQSPTLPSGRLTWERVQTLNGGADVTLLNNRLAITIDIFNRKTLGMLAKGAALPAVLGIQAPNQNVADLETKGWELEISWGDKAGDFSYGLGFNLSDNQTHITKFHNPGGLLSDRYAGQDVFEIWGYVTDRYYTVDDFEKGSLNANLTGGKLLPGIPFFKGVPPNPGDVKYVDLNGDGVIFSGNGTLADPGDRKIIGSSARRYQFGMFGNASYKNFDFNFFLQGVGKRDLWMGNRLFWGYIDQFSALYTHNLDYWTAQRTGAYYPRIYPNGSGNTSTSRNVQTKYLQNGAYLRVKNVTLAYNVPKQILSRAKVEGLRIFASGENLALFDHLPAGMEGDATDISNGGIYPSLKKFSCGLNLTF